MNGSAQVEIDSDNAAFWNELCGTGLAKHLGVTDNSPESLKKFDDWYMDFYPYLLDHIPFDTLQGKDVLEVGLGYGTVSQQLGLANAKYTGFDIASGPVGMVKQRLQQNNLQGSAQQGTILNAPFSDASFDYIIAIGCLHHTGDLQRAIQECHRLLRKGGKVIFMVYYAYSYRCFVTNPIKTLRYWMRETMGYRGVVGAHNKTQRASYDANQAGEAAPHTDWISMRSLKQYCSEFASFTARIENIDNGRPFGFCRPRSELLNTSLPRWCGLDLYATATK